MRWIRIDEPGLTTLRGTFDDAPGNLIRTTYPRLEATYEGNIIDVKAAGVKRYSILVSGEMLDLKRTIQVYTNEELSFDGMVEPDAKAILEEARRHKDRQLLYATRIPITIP